MKAIDYDDRLLLQQLKGTERRMPPALEYLDRAVLIASEALLLASALHDVATRTVPNWVSVALIVAAVFLRISHGDLPWGLLAAAVIFAVTALFWRAGWMGGADVKLLTASALLVPPGLVASLVLAVSLAGGALVLIYLLLRPFVGQPKPGRPNNFLLRICRVERRRIRRLESLPYASAIAVGALFTLMTV